MKFYKDFYDNYVIGDSSFQSIPQLIIICEDDKHMALTFKELITHNIEIDKIKWLFSTDLRQNKETLKNTLVEFKIDETTKKYKMEEIELKFLDN